MKCNGFMKPALAPASALALVCALALAALLGCKNPASGGNETETPRDVQFTITFDSAGGTEVPPLTGDEGSKIDKPEDPAREGYAFLGWFTEPEGGALFTAWPYTLAGDLTLYARWHNDAYGQILEYTITFNAGGGTEVSVIKVYEGTPVGKPVDPVKDGYAFQGWFDAESGGTKYEWPHTLAGDLIVYAQWLALNRYTITFDSAGGTEVPQVTGYEGVLVDKPADPVFEGYAFLDWFDAESGGTKYEWPHTLAGDLIVYAQWLALNRYTITFDSAGGTEVPQVTDYEGATVDKPVDPNRDEYIFLGWFDAALGGTKYEWPLEVSGDLTLYAQWTGISYTVEYDANGGTGSTAATSHVYGTESPLAENGFSREGYNFEGWNTQTGGQGLNYSAGQFVKNLAKEDGAAVKLYARWTDIVKPVYTISFNSNKGSQVEAIKDNVGAFAGAPVDPILRGYIFQGWYGAAEGGTKYDWPLEVSGDLTLYAQWTLASYTITYNLNGGSNVGGNPVAYTYTIESNGIILASPAKSGAVFGGWYENEKFSGSAVTSIPKGSVGDKTFWAKWTPITYAVSYNLNGGSNAAGNPAAYTIESKAITLAAPSRAGYDFGGWYANADFSGGAVDVIYAGSTGDKTFWAKWEPVSYAISYNLNGGSNAAGNPAAYTIETANITLAAPSRADYYFGGWFDNEKFSGRAVTSIPQKSTGNKSFWAKWTPTYKVTYYPNGGSGSVDQSVHVMGGSNVLASNGFTRSDYVFAGWTTSSGDGAGTLYWAGRGVPDLASRPGAEVTLYARWLPKEQTIELADSPARKSGHNTANALLWQFFPERNEFVIFAGQDYKSKTDSTVYVTGRTTVNRIRVLPGRSLNNWADVPGYSPSGAYAHNQWQNALWADWPLIFPDLLTGPTSGYVSGQVIPKPVLLGQIYNAHQIRIIFVNAEIEIPSVQGENSRSPLDIGPYHTFWKDNSWEGDFYKSTLGSDLLNDHEIDASIEFFEGENKLYTPSSPGISLWDSRKQGYAYVNEIPWQPDSDSYDSWKTKENISHWKSYAIKCVTFARNWGYPLDYSPHDGSIETGPGVVGHRFQSFGWGPSFLDVTFRGGSLNASNGASGVVELSAGGYKIIPSTGNAWTRRTTTK